MENGEKGLIEGVLQGNPGSHEEVSCLYGDKLYRLAYSLLLNKEEARDVVQETISHFMEEVRNGRFFADSGSIRGFLYVTAQNLCFDRHRSLRRFRLRTDEIRDLEASRRTLKNPDEVAEEVYIQEAIRGGLPELTEIQHAIFVLHDLNEESAREIAERLGLSVNNVNVHLCRARKRMRTILARFVEK